MSPQSHVQVQTQGEESSSLMTTRQGCGCLILLPGNKELGSLLQTIIYSIVGLIFFFNLGVEVYFSEVLSCNKSVPRRYSAQFHRQLILQSRTVFDLSEKALKKS